MLRSNAHLNVKRGHSLDNTCSFGAANLATKNSGNHLSWEFNFKKSPRTPVADPRGGGGFGTCSSPPPPHVFGFFLFSFYRNEVYEQKVICSTNEYEICLKMLEMAILETRISEIFGRGGEVLGMPQTPLEKPRFRRSLCPLLLWKSWTR